MIITGASSGIGPTTARMVAAQGAKLVLAARSENALHELVSETKAAGGDAIYVVVDVTKEAEIQHIADTTISTFGGFDTGPIDTPFPINAKNYLETEPKHVPPVYAPRNVAEAILHSAQHPTLDTYAGSGAAGNAAIGNNAPGLADKLGEGVFIRGSYSDKPAHRKNSLDAPTEHLAERGSFSGLVTEVSLYTQAALHLMAVGALAVGAGVVLASLLSGRKNVSNSRQVDGDASLGSGYKNIATR